MLKEVSLLYAEELQIGLQSLHWRRSSVLRLHGQMMKEKRDEKERMTRELCHWLGSSLSLYPLLLSTDYDSVPVLTRTGLKRVLLIFYVEVEGN